MCIIAYKPAGVEMPDYETLENCFYNNFDGCGYAYQLPSKQWQIRKGYFDLDDMVKDIHTSGITDDMPVILHFRIATGGGVSAGTCHPFPVSKKRAQLFALSTVSDTVVAHNGILFSVPIGSDMSDTQIFIRDILADIEHSLESKKVLKTLEKIISSDKMVIATKNKITLLGSWQGYKGVFFSNNGYLTSSCRAGKFSRTFKTRSDWYDDDECGYICDKCGREFCLFDGEEVDSVRKASQEKCDYNCRACVKEDCPYLVDRSFFSAQV